MKLLPKKVDIDQSRAQERKLEIDTGMALAKSVDKLREQLAIEKKNLLDWREENIARVKGEVDELVMERDNLKKEVSRLEEYRKELIKPLDKEWAEINETKEDLIRRKEAIYISGEQLKLEEVKVENERKKITEIVSRVTQNEKDTQKAKDEAISLKEMAQREYEIAKEERHQQNDALEKSILELDQRKKEYEVALSVISIRENEVKEKESELIIREKHLASQQVALRIAREITKTK